MSKIKLLIITDEMEVGGTQRQITRLLTQLDKERYQISLIYFRNESFLIQELKLAGVDVIKIPKKGKIDIQFLIELYRTVKNGHFDIVHCFAFSAELWGSIVCLFVSGSKLITSIRGTYEWYNTWQWRLKSWISNQSTTVISNSRSGANYALDNMKVDSQRVQVVYNGIDDLPKTTHENIEQLKSECAIEDHQVIIGFIGRLVEHKNLYCLIRAIKKIKDHNTAFKLVIVGDGPLMTTMKALTQDITELVTFLGERGDVPALLNIFDIVVLPSFREGLSNTILEAMASGLPVIASHVGGNPELIDDNKNGLLFANDDDDALSKCLVDLIDNKEKRCVLGEEARRKVNATFSTKAMVNNMSSIYQQSM